VSIVSAVAGTTTDPVGETDGAACPSGRVQFVDTAGVDDEGRLRTAACSARGPSSTASRPWAWSSPEAGMWGALRGRLVAELKRRHVPAVVAVNKIDERPLGDEERARLQHAGCEL